MGILLAELIYLIVTLAVVFFLTKFYKIKNNLKSEILYKYPALKGIIKPTDILIGYSLEKTTPKIMFALIFERVSEIVILVLIFYVLLMRKIWKSISKSTKK